MNETVMFWLESFLNEKIDEVQSKVKDSATWLLKNSDQEALKIELDNLSLYNEYLIALKKLKNRVEREEI